jgi:aspartate kinase
LIVMKFGGTSVADASRILAACEIVRARRDRRPMVVVSALAGVTDRILEVIAGARRGDRDAVEPALAELERRHRWALAGAVESAAARHDLSLEVDALFEEFRQLVRSVRILGEGTPRAADTLLAFGETLSSKILAAAMRDRGLPACWIDARHVIVTDARHGSAEADVAATEARSRSAIAPALDAGEIPIVGGFVGATGGGVTTTLGRGGSDTSASVLGSVLGAEEIQIWTDVDGILTADPRMVPEARTLERISFSEAAELAYYGARVLHPSSIVPAVRERIPVRVLNSLRPEGPGTLILGEVAPDAPPVASVASRGGVTGARVTGRRLRIDPGFLPKVLEAFDRRGLVPDLVVSSEVALTLVVQGAAEFSDVAAALGGEATVEALPDLGVLCVVGSGLARDPGVRGRVLASLAAMEPEMIALGGSATSATAVVPAGRLERCVRELHRRFFEPEGSS